MRASLTALDLRPSACQSSRSVSGRGQGRSRRRRGRAALSTAIATSSTVALVYGRDTNVITFGKTEKARERTEKDINNVSASALASAEPHAGPCRMIAAPA